MFLRCWPQSKASNSCSSFYGGSKASRSPVCAPKVRLGGRVNQRQFTGHRGTESAVSLDSRSARTYRRSYTASDARREGSLQGPLEVFQLIADQKWARDRGGGRGGTPCLAHVLRHEDASKRAFHTEKADLASKPIAGLSLVFSAGLLRACPAAL